jgi:hypothetical protein
VLFALADRPLPERATLAARAEVVESRHGLPARKWLRMMRTLPSGRQSPR